MACGEPQWWYEMIARKNGLHETPENQERFQRWNEGVAKLPTWNVGDVLTVAVDWDPGLWHGMGQCPKISRGEICFVVAAQVVGFVGSYGHCQELTIVKSTGVHTVKIEPGGGILSHAPFFQKVYLDEE